MTRTTALIVALAATACSLFATVDKDQPERNVMNPPYAIARGIANTATCWLEYPRCMVYDTSRLTPMGFLLFPFTGTFYTSARIIFSVLDIGLLGFTGPNGYNDKLIREYVFQMPWNAYAGEDNPKEVKAPENKIDESKLKTVNLNTLL